MKKVVFGRRMSLKEPKQQWTSLAQCCLGNNQNNPSTNIITQTSEKYEIDQELQLTVLTEESSMLLSKNRRNDKRMRFTDLEEFQKENFPEKNTAQSSMINQFQKQQEQQIPQQKPYFKHLPQPKSQTQLEFLTKNLQLYKRQSLNCLMSSQLIYGRQIQIINQYYKQLHLMLDVEKNKHYNNILIMKKNTESRMKITSQMAEIYLEEINCIMQKINTHVNSQMCNFQKSINKFKSFLSSSQPKDLDIYQFQLGNIQQIKIKFQKLIKIDIPGPSIPLRRQKSQSMGPRLKILSPSKTSSANIGRYSINKMKQPVIQQQGDLQYTDGQQSTEEIQTIYS